MNVFDAASTLPNGLHDAVLKNCAIDFAKGTARLDLDAWVGDLDSPKAEERERYEPVELCLSGLIYFHIDPGEKWHLRPVMPSRVDLCEADPERLPEIKGMFEYFKARFFVEAGNTFIHFSAVDAVITKK
jgi:hypothetical protein